MYEIVSRAYYKEVTSLIHGSMHAGKFIAGSLGQILLSFEILTLDYINYISFCGSVLVVVFALFLPGIKWSLYWHPQSPSEEKQQNEKNGIPSLDLEKGDHDHHHHDIQQTGKSHQNHHDHINSSKETLTSSSSFFTDSIKNRFSSTLSELKNDIVVAYTNEHVARWSVWWAMSRAIYWQIALFTESLWKQIEMETHQHPLNGAVDAAHALISK